MTQEEQVETPANAATAPVVEAEPATAPESEGAEPEKETSPDEKPKPKGGFQRRIDELTRNWRESERRLDEAMSMLRQQATPQAVTPSGPPTLEQFGYDEAKFQTAMTEHVKRVSREEAVAAFQEQQQKVQHETRLKTFRERESEFANSVEGYFDKVYDPSLPMSPSVVELIAESDIGPRVAYYLADNPDVARKIASMTPTQSAREFGKLEVKLSNAAPVKAVSKAPPPPPKIDATEPEVEKDPDKMSTTEWLKWREKSLRKKG